MSKSWTNTALASSNAATITIPAPLGSGLPIVLESVGFSYNGTPSTAGLLSIESPASTLIYSLFVTAGGAGPFMLAGSGIQGAAGQAVVVKLSAVPGVLGAINALQRTN